MRLAVVGASGRMGRAVVRLAHAAGMELVCAVGSTAAALSNNEDPSAPIEVTTARI